MKKCPSKLLVLVATFFLAVSAVFADAVSEGVTAFDKGDFQAATRAFETAISANPPSAALYYNLGLAQRKAEQPAEAAVSFRRALMLDPGFIDARMALSDLDRSSGVTLSPANWKSSLAEKIPLAPLLYTGFVLFWIGAFTLILGVFASSARSGRTILGFGACLIGGLLFYAAFVSDPRISDRDLAVLGGSKDVTLHSIPADRSEEVAKLPSGSPVRVLSRNGEWVFCESAAGSRGWAPANTILPVLPSAS